MKNIRRFLVIGALVACGALACTASATTFSAREAHRGLVTDEGNGTPGALVPTSFFRLPGGPMYVYKVGGVTVAGVWSTGPDAAVVRGGTSSDSPLIGRIVPSWQDGSLRLTIAPANGPAVTMDVFDRDGHAHGPTLTRAISTRADLEGTYRTTLRSSDTGKTGWLTVQVDPEGATRFQGDIQGTIPPALAAAAVEAINGEVGIIYDNLVDVAPLRRWSPGVITAPRPACTARRRRPPPRSPRR